MSDKDVAEGVFNRKEKVNTVWITPDGEPFVFEGPAKRYASRKRLAPPKKFSRESTAKTKKSTTSKKD